jgi:hypothetical protein
VKSIVKYAGQVAAGTLPAALLLRLDMPALAAVLFLAVLVLGVVCWIIGSQERSDRVARMMLARQGNARCLRPSPGAAMRRTTSTRTKLSEVIVHYL